MSARFHAESAAHAGWARPAASTAASTSARLASGASASVSPVTGETMVRARSPVAATHVPPTKFSSVRTARAMHARIYDARLRRGGYSVARDGAVKREGAPLLGRRLDPDSPLHR